VELNSGNLGSRCEAVIAVLQGLMSSEVELVPGGVTGDVTGSELAEVCQQSHVSVTGRNMLQVFAKHGTLTDIISDWGKHFISQFWRSLCQFLGIKASNCLPPQD